MFVLDYVGYPAPEVKTAIESGMPLVLVDHNDTLQSISNVSQANIVGIVDHHAVSTSIATNGPMYCNINPVGSTNTIVYSIYNDCNITPTKDIARIMLAGIIADTDSLTKHTIMRHRSKGSSRSRLRHHHSRQLHSGQPPPDPQIGLRPSHPKE